MTNTMNKAAYRNTNVYDPFENMTEEEINIFDEAYDEWLEEMERQDAIEEEMEEARKLNEYYNKYIKDGTNEMLALGNEICMMGYDLYREIPKEERSGYVFDKKYDEFYLNAFNKANPGYSMDYLEKCYDLANHWSFYSDWHKDVWGYRPR